MERTLTEEGTTKPMQHAEVITALAIGQVAKEGKGEIYIFSKTWSVYYGIAIR